jgi:hypothetical protein
VLASLRICFDLSHCQLASEHRGSGLQHSTSTHFEPAQVPTTLAFLDNSLYRFWSTVVATDGSIMRVFVFGSLSMSIFVRVGKLQ